MSLVNLRDRKNLPENYLESIQPSATRLDPTDTDTRALQKFPYSAELWILAADYEYNTKFNFPGARNLFLRALRMNSEKRELWWEFARMSCLYVIKLLERRRILGLDTPTETEKPDDTGFQNQDTIELPTISMEDLQPTEGLQLNPLLDSPLANIATNPVLNGAISKAIYSSAIESCPNDIALVFGFYKVFLQFSDVQFVDSMLDTIKTHLDANFPGRGLTLCMQVVDHSRGVHPAGVRFPSALRAMMKTASALVDLEARERKVCGDELLDYLDGLQQNNELNENLDKAIGIFKEKVQNWRDIQDA